MTGRYADTEREPRTPWLVRQARHWWLYLLASIPLVWLVVTSLDGVDGQWVVGVLPGLCAMALVVVGVPIVFNLVKRLVA